MPLPLPGIGLQNNDFTYITDAKTIADSEKQKLKGSKYWSSTHCKNRNIFILLFRKLLILREIGAEKLISHISHRLGKHADASL